MIKMSRFTCAPHDARATSRFRAVSEKYQRKALGQAYRLGHCSASDFEIKPRFRHAARSVARIYATAITFSLFFAGYKLPATAARQILIYRATTNREGFWLKRYDGGAGTFCQGLFRSVIVLHGYGDAYYIYSPGH